MNMHTVVGVLQQWLSPGGKAKNPVVVQSVQILDVLAVPCGAGVSEHCLHSVYATFPKKYVLIPAKECLRSVGVSLPQDVDARREVICGKIFSLPYFVFKRHF